MHEWAFQKLDLNCTTHLTDMTCLMWYFSLASFKLVQWLGSISWSAGKTRCVNYIAKNPILLHVFVFHPWVLVSCNGFLTRRMWRLFYHLGKAGKIDWGYLPVKCLSDSHNLNFSFRVANPTPGDLPSCRVNQTHLNHML